MEMPLKVHRGELTIRTLAMPAQTNPNGDIFGGWLVAQMDLAGASVAYQIARSRIVTVAIDSMSFIAPVKVGDFVCCYAELIKIGTTSLTIRVQAWVVRSQEQIEEQVTEGIFTFVAIDDNGKPQPVRVSA